MSLKDAINAYGRQISFSFGLRQVPYDNTSIVSVKMGYEGTLFKTLMRECTVELENVQGDFVGERILSPTFSVFAPNATTAETKAYGTFIVNECNEKEETNSIELTCYDLMLLSMTPYDLDLSAAYTDGIVTVRYLLAAICERLGWTLSEDAFINEDVVIPREMYSNEYTFRAVLDDIAAVACAVIMFDDSDVLTVKYPAETDEVIAAADSETLKIEPKYGEINALVLSRMPQEDNIEIRDTDSIQDNGLTEVKIVNNMLIESWRVAAENDIADSRADNVKAAMFEYLNGLYFYPFELKGWGCLYLDPISAFTVKRLDDSEYPVILLSDSIEIGQGLKETLSAEALPVTETDYTATSQTDRLLNQTILRVDKQAGRIEEIISRTDTLTDSVEGMESTVTDALERVDTAEASIINIRETVERGVTEVTTETGFTFNRDGLRITKSGSEMESLTDDTGLHVTRSGETVLEATADGVNAINLTARKYFVIGRNSRFEDYQTNRTACFYIGG